MLQGKGVSKNFGGVAALVDVHFEVGENEIVGLIGPNGAGKTTLFNIISGVYRPDAGTIVFKGKNITKSTPHEICHLGLARTYQIVRPFHEMSVLHNAMVGVLFGKARVKKIQDAKKQATDFLEFCGLAAKQDVLARNLTLADRKRLEIVRALACMPSVIMLDEVMSGLNPVEVADAMGLVKRIRKDLGISVFLVEHVMKAVMEMSDRIMVLHEGRKIAEGRPKEVAEDTNVIRAYLGEAYA